jgi:hypothetical protein
VYTNFWKNSVYLFAVSELVIGQFPPAFVILFLRTCLCFLNSPHSHSKWSVVCGLILLRHGEGPVLLVFRFQLPDSVLQVCVLCVCVCVNTTGVPSITWKRHIFSVWLCSCHCAVHCEYIRVTRPLNAPCLSVINSELQLAIRGVNKAATILHQEVAGHSRLKGNTAMSSLFCQIRINSFKSSCYN